MNIICFVSKNLTLFPYFFIWFFSIFIAVSLLYSNFIKVQQHINNNAYKLQLLSLFMQHRLANNLSKCLSALMLTALICQTMKRPNYKKHCNGVKKNLFFLEDYCERFVWPQGTLIKNVIDAFLFCQYTVV